MIGVAGRPTGLRWNDLAVEVTDGGDLELHGPDWTLSWRLTGSDELGVADAPRTRVDADEVECRWTGPTFALTLRHGFDHAWNTRIMVENLGDDVAVLDGLRIEWRVSGAAVGWCWPAGSVGLLAVLPESGAAALVQQIRVGDLGVDGRLAPVHVQPGGRHIQTLRAELRAVDRLESVLPSTLPALDLAAGEPLRLDAPDLALEPTPDTEVDEATGELWPTDGPGRYPLTLHGPDGQVRLEVSWAPQLTDVLVERAGTLLSDAPARRGVPRLETARDALLVARAGLDEDAVDAWCARAGEPADPWEVLALAERAIAGGEVDLLDRAVDGLARVRAGRGAGFAAARVLAACVALGLDPTGPVSALERLRHGRDAAVELELRALGLADASPALLPVRAHLGAGLPGDPELDDAGDAGDAGEAWWIALAELLTERAGESGVDLGRHAQARARRLLAAGVDDDDLCWLTCWSG